MHGWQVELGQAVISLEVAKKNKAYIQEAVLMMDILTGLARLA